MATSVLQPEEILREHEPKPDKERRLTEDERIQILEAKERETGELPLELRDRARLELREEPALRDQALAQMRHFIDKHPAIKKCRTGKKSITILVSNSSIWNHVQQAVFRIKIGTMISEIDC